MYTSLADLDSKGNIIPGIAESWEPSKDPTSWVFKLRKGVLFHNGRAVDAEAVKLNIERIQDPAIGGQWERGAIENIASIEVIDKHTLRVKAREADAGIPVAVMHYPTRMIAPDAFDKVAKHPIGTGPFKFVSWPRWNEARLARFENYWETDAQGHNLPYLDEIISNPKKEDSVRMTALRTGQVQFISRPRPMSSSSKKTMARLITPGAGITAAAFWSATSGAGPSRTNVCALRPRTPSTARPSITRCITAMGAWPISPTRWETPGIWRGSVCWNTIRTGPKPC